MSQAPDNLVQARLGQAFRFPGTHGALLAAQAEGRDVTARHLLTPGFALFHTLAQQQGALHPRQLPPAWQQLLVPQPQQHATSTPADRVTAGLTSFGGGHGQQQQQLQPSAALATPGGQPSTSSMALQQQQQQQQTFLHLGLYHQHVLFQQAPRPSSSSGSGSRYIRCRCTCITRCSS